MSKPATGDGYDRDQLDQIRRTCLYIATKLGDLLDEIVVVGGLVPNLLVDQNNLPLGLKPHSGTMDLDVGLALGILNEQRYRELSARLRGAGFAPDVNDQGNPTLQRWTTGPPQPVKVDFLIPPSGESDRGNRIRHIETDLAANNHARPRTGLRRPLLDRVGRPYPFWRNGYSGRSRMRSWRIYRTQGTCLWE